MKSLIQELVETIGPSGYEMEVRDLIRSKVEPLADNVHIDALGNLIATKGKISSRGIKIMLAAHMDEIGVMATHIDENGFIRFTTIGGVRRQTCVGGRVRFLNGTMGVINHDDLGDVNKLPTFNQMFIDVGATNQGDCPVRVGDVAASGCRHRSAARPEARIRIGISGKLIQPNLELDNSVCPKLQGLLDHLDHPRGVPAAEVPAVGGLADAWAAGPQPIVEVLRVHKHRVPLEALTALLC